MGGWPVWAWDFALILSLNRYYCWRNGEGRPFGLGTQLNVLLVFDIEQGRNGEAVPFGLGTGIR